MKKLLISSALIMAVSAGAALSIYASDEGKIDASSSLVILNELRTNEEITDVNNPNNPYFYPPVKLSEEDIERSEKNIDSISTPDGTFNKVAKKDASISEKETVDNIYKVTADTKQILHYGNYFVKIN